MKKAILTGVLVISAATTAFADRGSRYDGGGRGGLPVPPGFSRGGGGLPVPPGFSRGGGGLPVPPGVPAALVPGNRHSFLPAPPLPGFRHLPVPPIPFPSVMVHGEYSHGRGGYAAPVYCPPPVYYAPRPVIVAAPIYFPQPVYVYSPPVVYVSPAPVIYAAPVAIWNPPVCRPSYYGGSGVSVSFSFGR